MGRTNLLETRSTQFGDLIGNGRLYRVPPFQRDYSWQEENWEDLWQDILNLHKNPDASHYMGALVLQTEKDSERVFTVIDGQQRLATLSIVTMAVIAQIQALGEAGRDVDANQERQDILKRTYLADKDPRSLTYASKLRDQFPNQIDFSGKLSSISLAI
jgi:uncharacterized protein with ParB-like and HNH nuclease domain